MLLHKIVYVRGTSLDQLQMAVEEEFIERAEHGHTFIQALPIIPPQKVVSAWVQPLVFQYAADPTVEYKYSQGMFYKHAYSAEPEDILP